MAWIKGAHRLPAVPSRAIDEAEEVLREAARRARLALHLDDAARHAGRPHLRLFARGVLLAEFRDAAAGIAWLRARGR